MEFSYELIKSLIPNIIFEAEDEPTLLDSLRPWLMESLYWLKENVVGYDEEVLDLCQPEADNTIVYRAFALAAPHIDVTVTPTGFGVVNTQNIAPASKERVQKLVEGAWRSHKIWMSALVSRLYSIPQWKKAEQSRQFLCSLLSLPSDVDGLGKEEDVMQRYREATAVAVAFEERVADRYVGHALMSVARDFIHFGTIPDGLMDEKETVANFSHMLKLATKTWVKGQLSEGYTKPLIDFDLISPALSAIKAREVTFKLWRRTTAHDHSKCEQSQGAFYF